MAQRYTTFIPGYVFNIFGTLYTRAQAHTHIHLYYYSLSSSEPILRKNFSEQSAQYRIEPKGSSLSVFYELMKHISISIFTSHKICTAEIFGSAFGQVFK